MGRQVALKVLAPELTRDEKFRTRFEKEIRLQAALNHPNIAMAYSAGNEGAIFYLAMEYLEGSSLEQNILDKGPYSEKNALRIIRKVAVGLSYAWKTSELIHRDIKPSNIIEDDEGKVKVLDMGVSKSLKNIEGGGEVSQFIVGTPQYMAPEQMRGSEELDLRADMFALGATLYHMITGAAPYPLKSIASVVEAQGRGPAPSPRDLRPEISPACVHLIRVMMAKVPGDRYPYWSSLIADISRVLSGQKPMTRAPSKDESLVAASSGLKVAPLRVGSSDRALKDWPRGGHAVQQKRSAHSMGWILFATMAALIGIAMILSSDPSRDKGKAVEDSVITVKVDLGVDGLADVAAVSNEVAALIEELAPEEAPQLADLHSFITNRIATFPDRYQDHQEAIDRLKIDAEFFGFSRYTLLAKELETALAEQKEANDPSGHGVSSETVQSVLG